ncbi:MAG: hypothetical protein KAR79_04800, partial [Simkaniaceae bacterium]|nr:hypothetical protein [Simkaniaceae bacterium]
MAVAVAPREIGVLDYLADFSDEKTKYVNRCVKDLALWLGEIGKYAEIELIDHEIVDLGNLTKGLKLCDGAFDLATLPKEMVDFSSIVSSGGVRDVSRATSSLIGSVCKSALWLGKADVLPLGAATSSFSAVKSVSTIYSMGNNAIDDGIKLYSARSRAIAETGTQERINSLK